jgi:IS5 family transposase
MNRRFRAACRVQLAAACLPLAAAISQQPAGHAHHGAASPLPITREQLTAVAKAQIAITAAHDSSNAKLAKSGNKTDAAQQEIQNKFLAQIAGILSANGLTEAQYKQGTFLASSDTAVRRVFDSLVVAITGAPLPGAVQRGPQLPVPAGPAGVHAVNGFSYEELAFHLNDSATYRSFCRIGFEHGAITAARLKVNLKRVKAETLEAINRNLVLFAAASGVEEGEKVRTDCTVVESNIHYPTDSSLLWDCVRVLTRLMGEAAEDFDVQFNDHTRRAKRRALGILNAKSNEQRLPLYRDLLKMTHKTVKNAERIANELDEAKAGDMRQLMQAGALATELRHYIELAKRVINQTERRVLYGESVPVGDKIVSIFETHTDIIVKERRETHYGHKVALTAGASGIVTDIVVEAGNPADSTLAVEMIERQKDIYGKAPRQVSFDGAFASKENLEAIKALDVKDVAFSKRRGMSVEEMATDRKVYRALRNFRAGVEGIISYLKRSFGLDRCLWKGLASFKAYVQASVLACNLLVVARLLLNPSA